MLTGQQENVYYERLKDTTDKEREEAAMKILEEFTVALFKNGEVKEAYLRD